MHMDRQNSPASPRVAARLVETVLSIILFLGLSSATLAAPLVLPANTALQARLAGYPIDAGSLPSAVTAAFVAQEDRYFWERLEDRKTSTLTEAATRLLLSEATPAWSQASPLEKKDAVEEVTKRLDAPDILTLYLNLLPFGEELTGLDAAARHYFDHPADKLSPAQSAWLAAISRSPALALMPANRDRTNTQRDYILREMAKSGAITEEDLADQLSVAVPGE